MRGYLTRTGYCIVLGLSEARSVGEAEAGCEKPPFGCCQSSIDMLHCFPTLCQRCRTWLMDNSGSLQSGADNVIGKTQKCIICASYYRY